MFSRFKSQAIPRAKGITNRMVILGLGGRFTDELLSNLPDVLMPAIRAQLGLSYTQISLLSLVLNYVAAVIEPIGGLLIDLWPRRWLLTWGAIGVGLATITMGLAPTFALLVVGYAIYGLASGPLAHTADVVLVEAHPEAPGRIFARSVSLDTLGAMLAPLSVAVVSWLGLEWRWLMVALGASSIVYGLLLYRTHFLPPANSEENEEAGLWASLRGNVRWVIGHRPVLAWLLFIFLLELLETPHLFQTVWLHEESAMSQGLIGLYRALEMVISLVSLAYLDRWLARTTYRRIITIAGLGLLFLYPAWLLLPGLWPRFLLALPLNFLFTVFWPIGRGQLLAAAPGRAGTVTALSSLLGFLPLSLLFGLLAEAISLTTATFWVTIIALIGLLLATRLLPPQAEN